LNMHGASYGELKFQELSSASKMEGLPYTCGNVSKWS